jgi:hypothetical protein
VTARQKRVRPGIVTYRRTLSHDDVTTHHGIRVTGVVRTIIDIAPRLTDRQLARAINEPRHSGHLHPMALDELLRRCPRAQSLVDPTQNPTRSPLEDDFLAFTERYDLPTPRINTRKSGTEVDAVFETERVIVELDSWEFHGDPIAFHNDRVRDMDRADEDYLPLRMTADRLTSDQAEQLRRILSRRR